MAPKLPTLEDLHFIAEEYNLDMTEDDLESFQGLIAGGMASYARIDQLTEPKPPVKYPRDGGYRPQPEDNPLRA